MRRKPSSMRTSTFKRFCRPLMERLALHDGFPLAWQQRRRPGRSDSCRTQNIGGASMRKLLEMLSSVLLLVGGSSADCVLAAESSGEEVAQEDPIPFLGIPEEPRNIFVFLDGTSNVAADRTNVRRMFELVSKNADSQKTGLYISGVGTDSAVLTGNALGRGMESRIARGLQFICNHFRPKDRVFVFGFSRGAHQARALTGILAYSGQPAPVAQDRDSSCSLAMIDSIIEITKKAKEKDFVEFWNEKWTSDALPPLSGVLKKKLNLQYPDLEGSAGGTAHWSFNSGFGSAGSSCLDRKLDAGGVVDPSIDSRMRMAPVPVIVGEQCVLLPYPVSCKDIGGNRNWDGSKLRGGDTKPCHRTLHEESE
jgi:Uncharacterized alpha/beta hydrolase domain (DUF2235)